jgi:hypothetical protein
MFVVSILGAILQLLPALIADQVAANEGLYRDLDVTYTSEYRLAGNRAGGELRAPDGQLVGRITLAEDVTTRAVLQKEMYRFTVATKTTAGKEVTTRFSAHAFDGKTTLIREGDVTQTFDGARSMPREGYFPHLWAIAPSFDAYPLSAAIAGGKKWEPFRDRHSLFKGASLSSKALNLSASFADEPCVVIRCELVRPPRPGVSSVQVYWLATNKNYLPVKTEKYALNYSEKLPIETVECGDFRELRKGVWLPYRVTKTVFDELELRDGKKQVVSNITKISVTAAKSSPGFERAFFQDVQRDK